MVNATSFAIKTAVFEGPLDLLIELVEKRKLLINDISLATVTDEYMARVSAMQDASVPHTAQFVALAATLLLIKSKSLLPILELTSEETATIEDLEARLKYYQLFKRESQHLGKQFGTLRLALPENSVRRNVVFKPDQYCSQPALKDAITRVLHALPRPEPPKPTAKVKPTITLEMMITRLYERIERQLSVSFAELRAGETEHKNIIVSFLAILEIVKQGDIIVSQSSRFSDITVERDRAATPRYM